MPAISKAWVVIADAAVDPDSPLDTSLITGLRDNDIHLREWLGASFFAGAVQNHNHDGANSSAIDTGVLVKNGSFEDGTTGWTLAPFTGGTIAVNTANDMDGATALGITSTSTANGGGEATTAGFTPLTGALRVMSFSLAVKASVANVSSKAEVFWYDDAQAQISANTIYNTGATSTTSSVQTANVTPPATARYFKVKITGGVPGSGTATGTIYFDGVQCVVKTEMYPFAAATCTYTGSLVETGALTLYTVDSSFVAAPGTSATVDIGSNRVLVGLRLDIGNGVNSPGLLYARGSNIKNN